MTTTRSHAAALVRIFAAAVCAVTLAAPSTPAAASFPPPPPPAFNPFTDQKLQDALNDSVARSRLLIVVVSSNSDRAKKFLPVFNNPALDSWIKAHAILVNVTDKETFKTLLDGGLQQTEPEVPLVFRDGKQIRLFGSNVKATTSRLRNPPKEAAKWPADEANASLRMYFKLDWTLRSAQRSDPEWYARHLAANPPNANPQATATLFDQPATGVTPLAPPANPEPFALVTQARSLIAAKDFPAATGLLTYLWEGPALASPVLTPTLCFAVAPLMHELAQKHPPALKRFRALRDAQAAKLPSMSPAETFTHLVLHRVVGDHLEALDFLDSALSDGDSGLMMPQLDRIAYELFLPRLNWSDGLTLKTTTSGTEAARYLAGLVQRITGAPPGKMDEVAWKQTQATLRFLHTLETARLHAALLGANSPEEAFDIIVQQRESPVAHAAAISLAVALGRASEHHSELIDESIEKVAPNLRPALERALKR